MFSLPAIVLENPFDTLGDNVLLEPIAVELASIFRKVYIAGTYPELFDAHPTVTAVDLQYNGVPDDTRILDMTSAIASVAMDMDGDEVVRGTIFPRKFRRMVEAAGLREDIVRQPKLYLEHIERNQAKNWKAGFQGRCVAVVLASKHPVKDWPYTELFLKKLVKQDCHVFVVSKDEPAIDLPYVIKLINLPIRELMWKLWVMDVVVGPDTGIMHVAGALDVPTIVLTRDIWRDFYEIYKKCEIIAVGRKEYDGQRPEYVKYVRSHDLRSISIRKVLKKTKKVLSGQKEDTVFVPANYVQTNKHDIALFRLDGLGGTVTLSNHAKKIFEMTGKKSVLIIRNYGQLFKGNPYIKTVIERGSASWDDCIAEAKTQFHTVVEIRFALAKCHQKGKKVFDQDFSKFESMFDNFILNFRDLEEYGLHHVQISDMNMGLPYDTIDCEIYNYDFSLIETLPEQYVVVNNGVDAIHEGLRQTKTWDYWDRLVDLVDLPVVQVGTTHDDPILNAIDLRGKTNMPQLCGILKSATLVLCCEGGLMHLGYAVGNPNVLVIRGPTRGKLFEYPGQKFVDSYICDNCWSMTRDWYANCPREVDAVCMKSITPERVAYNVSEVLDEAVV